MDGCLTNWNTEVDVELPLPSQRKPLGLDNDLMELLWHNGDVVLQSQTSRKPNFDHTCKSKQDQKHGMLISRADENPNTLTEDHEPVSWINYPIDELFEKDFYADFLSGIPSSNFIEPDKPSEKSDTEKVFRFSSPEVCAPASLPIPGFGSSEAFVQDQSLEGNKTVNLQFPFARQVVGNVEHGFVQESSVMTVGSSHCASNQVAKDMDMSWASSSGVRGRTLSAELEDKHAMKVRIQNSTMERETSGVANTSSGGSGSSCHKTSTQSNNSYKNKRKNMDVGEYECPSDATEMESAPGNNKSSRKSDMMRRSRVAEVHNLSERKRRDRINERMRALQELIPHSHKSDKASMLDEAIEYMKSLQLQLQLLWMGRGMAPMMHPAMHPYIYYAGMGIRPPTLPVIQNLMRLSRMPLVDPGATVASMSNQAPAGYGPVLRPVNYQNQMQNASFPEQQYTQNMGLHFTPDGSQQTINTFNFSPHSMEQNLVVTPPGNGSS